jgi:RNA polymerase sigma-70 factor (ECF subfamily)
MKTGDISGLESLIARYQVKAARTAYLITHDEALAEDVTQDVFLRVYGSIRRFDADRPFEPYLLRAVVNAALSAVERAGAHRAPDRPNDEDELENLIASAASVEDQVIYAQLVSEIETALAKLAPRQRAAVVQRYYLGMSEKEMAQSLQAPAGTIKRLLNNARKRLQALLVHGGINVP